MSTEEDRDMSDFDGRLRQQLRAIHDDINPGVVEAAFKRYEERIMGTNGHIRTPGEPANTMSRMQDQVDRLVNSDVNYAGDLVKAWGEVVELHEATKAVSQGFLDRAIRAEELNKLNIETFNKNEHAYIERALKLEDEVVELRAKAEAEVAARQAAADKLTAEIAAIDEMKAALLAGADMPIAGLAVTDDGILVTGANGPQPLEQASQAEQLRVAIAIAIRRQKLRDVMVRHGAFFTEKGLATLVQIAEELGCRPWVERPGEATGDRAVVIREGRVAAGGGEG